MRKKKYSFGQFLPIIFSIIIIFGCTYFIVNNYILPFFNRASQPTSIQIPVTTPATQSNEVYSPDGTMKLVMETKNQEDNTVFYSIFSETSTGENKKLLFSTTGSKGDFSLSQNSWSPDNKYIFLLKNENALTNALVFKITEDAKQSDKQYIDISSFFGKDTKTSKIINVTGWDSPTLLHVKTEKNDRSKGPAYWFDITSKIFMQLSG